MDKRPISNDPIRLCVSFYDPYGTEEEHILRERLLRPLIRKETTDPERLDIGLYDVVNYVLRANRPLRSPALAPGHDTMSLEALLSEIWPQVKY